MRLQKNTLTEEAKNELNKLKEIEKTVKRENLVDKTNEFTYGFRNFQTISKCGRNIYYGKITLKEADEGQNSLLVEIIILKKKTPQSPQKKQKEKDMLTNLHALFECRERNLNAFDSKTFPIKIEVAGF